RHPQRSRPVVVFSEAASPRTNAFRATIARGDNFERDKENPMPDRPLNRICYVEDDEDIQRIVRMSLERVGKMTVEVVGDPTMAITAIDTFKPDLVML